MDTQPVKVVSLSTNSGSESMGNAKPAKTGAKLQWWLYELVRKWYAMRARSVYSTMAERYKFSTRAVQFHTKQKLLVLHEESDDAGS